MDFSSIQTAEKLYEIKQKAMRDLPFKRELLASPEKVLEDNGIEIDDCKVIVEDNPSYGLYIAFSLTSNKVLASQHEESTANTSFIDQHFMDCHHY